MNSNELIAELDKISTSDIEEINKEAKERAKEQKEHEIWMLTH